MPEFDIQKAYEVYVGKEVLTGKSYIPFGVYLVVCQSLCEVLLNKK
jgi:hypothetical protein